MNTFKKFAYAGLASGVALKQDVFAATSANKVDFGADKAKALQGATAADGETAIMNVVMTLLGFVTLIAVLYALYGGFMIMTAGGDDGRQKKGRTIIIQVLIGIVVMWLAYAIVNLVVGALS